MMMKATLFGTVILLLGFMYGCTGLLINDSSEKQMGKVTVRLTDAPFPSDLVKEVNVTIDWIKFKISEDEGTEDETDFVVLDVNKTMNLLELANGKTDVLGVLEIPSGNYSEIRMHVTEARIVLNTGKEMDIKIPSASSSGLKIKINPALVVMNEEVSQLLLDFDVSRSFIVQGKSGNNGINVNAGEITGFIFNPVIRAVNVALAGKLSGFVEKKDDNGIQDFIKNAHIYVISSKDPEKIIATGKTDENGFYKIIGIPGGVYNVTCEKGDYNIESEPVSVEILAGKEAKLDFRL